MLVVNQLRFRKDKPGERTEEELRQGLSKLLDVPAKELRNLKILKYSLDARKKPELFENYQVGFTLANEKMTQRLLKRNKVTRQTEQAYHFPVEGPLSSSHRPVIVGAGPAGLFCAYYLAQAGLRPIILERGQKMEERKKLVQEFWDLGKLDPNCNVQFGEGGAGTFSDGKLQTQVKDKTGRIKEILRVFVAHGAPESILYVNKPHIGTDLLEEIIVSMRRTIEAKGGEFHFATTFLEPVLDSKVVVGARVLQKQEEKVIPCRTLIIAIGHSARDTFMRLHQAGLSMESKPFAVGFRVQHLQKRINELQYGLGYENLRMPAADYKVTFQIGTRNVYSFCMCPGGYVVNASSEEGRLAINGMSYHSRASANANSAIVLSVTKEDFGEGVFAGMEFQRRIEEKAYEVGNGSIPVQRLADFAKAYGLDFPCNEKEDLSLVLKGSSFEGAVNQILPRELNLDFLEAMQYYDKLLPGFADGNVWVSGIESRTSSPVKMLREANYQSNLIGLYPCGEGAGYAGGITSAAVDGLKVAEAVAMEYN